MAKLKPGDRVVALANPFVPIGTEGTIKEVDSSLIPYHVDCNGRMYWFTDANLELAPLSPSFAPNRELKAGDLVRIKSREWYEANKDESGRVNVPFSFTEEMSGYCGNVYTIASVESSSIGPKYRLEGTRDFIFSEAMFEDSVKRPALSAIKTLADVFVSKMKPSLSVRLIKPNKLLTKITLN